MYFTFSSFDIEKILLAIDPEATAAQKLEAIDIIQQSIIRNQKELGFV